MTDKRTLRIAALAARSRYVATLSPPERAALERALADRLRPHLAGIVASYAAFRDEIDPNAFMPAETVLWPRVVAAGLPLDFHACAAEALVPGKGQLREPLPSMPQQDPDTVLVPLLTVDRDGYSLGYGGGYYDRTLAALRQRRAVFAIGCAWDMQLVERVMREPWDERLDAIATPTRWLRP